MFLLTSPIVKNSHILARIYFIFLKERPRPNLKGFQYQSLPQWKDWKLLPKLSIKFERTSGNLKAKEMFPETIKGKIFERNFSFHVK